MSIISGRLRSLEVNYQIISPRGSLLYNVDFESCFLSDITPSTRIHID